MIRSVNTELLTENIKEMCIQANHYLAPDMEKAMREAYDKESKPLAKQILGQLLENLDIAGEDMIPICQDTGMAVVFLKIGQDVHFEGGSVEEAGYFPLLCKMGNTCSSPAGCCFYCC